MSNEHALLKYTSEDNYLTALASYIEKSLNDYNKLAEYIYHTSAIEGSILTLEQTLLLVKPGHFPVAGFSVKDTLETIGMLDAINLLKEEYKTPITEYRILTMQDNIKFKSSNGMLCGYRTGDSFTMVADDKIPELVSKHYYPSVPEMRSMISDLVSRDNKMTLSEIALYKLDFVKAHPFPDGNGRVSRLLLNWLLMYNDYPPVTIKVEDRNKYIKAVSSYSKTGDVQLFTTMLEQLVLDAMKEM